jgi:hypothetical protein
MTIDEKGNPVFTAEEQPVIDRMMQERVARVKIPSDYEELQAVNKMLDEIGIKGTPAEKAAILKQNKEAANNARAAREAAEKAEKNGTTPEHELEIKRLSDEQEKIMSELRDRKNKETEQQRASENAKKMVADFEEKYPDVDWKVLTEDPKFKKFAKSRQDSLVEAYTDYLEFVSEAETVGFLKAQDKRNRSTGGGDSNKGNNFGLTPRQLDLAKEFGMSAEKYAANLKKIKKE